MSAELLLAIPPTIDLCLKYIKEGRDLCSALKHADTEVSERCVRLDNNWLRFLSQLNFLQRTYQLMEDAQRDVYYQILQILQNKLAVVVSLLRKLIKPQFGGEYATYPAYKVTRWKYAAKKSSLDEAIEDLEKWQRVADQSWFLLLRIAHTQVDQALATCGGANGPQSDTAMNAMVTVRAGLQQVHSSTHGSPAIEHVSLSSSDLKSMVIQAVPFCEGTAVATRTHSNESASRYILNHIQCEPGAKPQILKRNVRDLVLKLQADDPYTFGLMKCKGFVAETVPAGMAKNLSLTLVFRQPPASHNPRSLRDILLNTPTFPSTTRKLELARDLARSVSYVHSFGFVHKNIRPESIVVFDRADGQGRVAFLVGFENFRQDEGWTQRRGDNMPDKNLYRHASRQGFSPRDDYEMRHDIYSLGVCLLEVGLWGSFVKYGFTGARTLSQLLAAPSRKGREPMSMFLQEQAKDLFIALARNRLPGYMGDRYAEIVETCLTCLDPGNVDFGDEKAFEDENGILVGARYIEKVMFRLSSLIM